jgi:hypothetical protein
MSKRTPNLFASGRFTLAAPFNTRLNPATDYTCIAIRSFEDFIAEGDLDIFEQYYVPDGIPRSTFDSDVIEKAAIITLQNTDGDIVHVPDTFIAKYPSGSSAGWSRVVISVDLGAVPDQVILDHLLTVLANATRDTVGVTPTVKLNKMTTPNSLTQNDIDLWLAATQANITRTKTDYALAKDKNLSLQAAVEQIQLLSNALIERGIVLT